jgi:putative transposase
MDHKHYNPDRFTRKSLRLANRDYTSAGAYFVTIRGLPPEPYFEIPKLHQILLDTWHALPRRFPNLKLDEFVIMPDHIHFILWLDGTEEHKFTLGSIVGAYKSITTVTWSHYLKSVGKDMEYPCRIWQANYYERVVRIEELEQTRQYIRNNPNKLKPQT